MPNQNILVIEPNLISQSVYSKLLNKYNMVSAHDAKTAIKLATEKRPDLVIMEMSLNGHSGVEFLYEFRTYKDWDSIPIIIYTSVRIDEKILNSRSWKNLGVYKCLYKPEYSITSLKSIVEKALSRV